MAKVTRLSHFGKVFLFYYPVKFICRTLPSRPCHCALGHTSPTCLSSLSVLSSQYALIAALRFGKHAPCLQCCTCARTRFEYRSCAPALRGIERQGCIIRNPGSRLMSQRRSHGDRPHRSCKPPREVVLAELTPETPPYSVPSSPSIWVESAHCSREAHSASRGRKIS